jgi:hypothetical protein
MVKNNTVLNLPIDVSAESGEAGVTLLKIQLHGRVLGAVILFMAYLVGTRIRFTDN